MGDYLSVRIYVKIKAHQLLSNYAHKVDGKHLKMSSVDSTRY